MKASPTARYESAVRQLSDSLWTEWEALAESVGTVFSSRPSYALNAPRPAGSELTVVEVRSGERLVALAPLYVTRLGPLKVARILGAGQGVPTELLTEDVDAARALWDAIRAHNFLFYADSMVDNRVAIGALAKHRRWHSEILQREHVSVIDVPSGSAAKDVRGRSSLKRLGQYRRRAERSGTPIDIETVRDADHLDRRWNDIAELAAAATSENGRTDYLAEVSPVDASASAKEFLAHEAAAGRVTISGLTVGGQWRAHQICVATGDRLEAWLTHYDPEIASYQPGHQMMEWFVDNHDSLGVTTLDLGVGVNEIKKSWSTSGYEVLAVVAAPRRMPGSRLLVGFLRRWELSPRFAQARKLAHAAVTRVRPA